MSGMQRRRLMERLVEFGPPLLQAVAALGASVVLQYSTQPGVPLWLVVMTFVVAVAVLAAASVWSWRA